MTWKMLRLALDVLYLLMLPYWVLMLANLLLVAWATGKVAGTAIVFLGLVAVIGLLDIAGDALKNLKKASGG